jgi:hypothetical protein
MIETQFLEVLDGWNFTKATNEVVLQFDMMKLQF